MKAFILTGLLGWIAGSALALSAENAVQSVEDLVFSNLTWTGEVTVGEPKVTLVGDAKVSCLVKTCQRITLTRSDE